MRRFPWHARSPPKAKGSSGFFPHAQESESLDGEAEIREEILHLVLFRPIILMQHTQYLIQH